MIGKAVANSRREACSTTTTSSSLTARSVAAAGSPVSRDTSPKASPRPTCRRLCCLPAASVTSSSAIPDSIT